MMITRPKLFKLTVPVLLTLAGALGGLPGTAGAKMLQVADTEAGASTGPSDIRRINQLARRAPVSSGVAADSTAMCRDGSISKDRDILSACAYRGGIERWFGAQPERRDSRTDDMATRG